MVACSRDGPTTKDHVDAKGRPFDLVLTAWQAHDRKPAMCSALIRQLVESQAP